MALFIFARYRRDGIVTFNTFNPFSQFNAGASIPGDEPVFVLPLTDNGSGVVNTLIDRGTGVATFTRATAAACRLSTGLWKLDVASGAARSHYLDLTPGSGTYTYGGYLSEPAATQLAVAPRDMTNAAWVAVNVTVAQTGTGIDGVVNACSRLTSGAIGGSVQQTVVAAASTRTYSCSITRISGTGTITINQGATTLDVTASLVTNFPVLVQLPASVLNAAFGITFGASGDVIFVDCNQFEAGGLATTPIPAAGTRNADSFVFSDITGFFNAAAGTIYYESVPNVVATDAVPIEFNDGTGNEIIGNDYTATDFARLVVLDGGVAQALIGSASLNQGAVNKIASSYAVNSFAISKNGGSVSTDVSGTLPTVDRLYIGSRITTLQLNGTIKNVRLWQTQLAPVYLQNMTS